MSFVASPRLRPGLRPASMEARAWRSLASRSASACFTGRDALTLMREDRKSTRLNSSHHDISYAVFCLKKNTVANAIAAQSCYAADDRRLRDLYTAHGAHRRAGQSFDEPDARLIGHFFFF